MEMTNEIGTASSGKNEILKKYTRQPYPALVKPAPNAEPDDADENENRDSMPASADWQSPRQLRGAQAG